MSRRWGCGGSARSGAVPRACVRCSARYPLPYRDLSVLGCKVKVVAKWLWGRDTRPSSLRWPFDYSGLNSHVPCDPPYRIIDWAIRRALLLFSTVIVVGLSIGFVPVALGLWVLLLLVLLFFGVNTKLFALRGYLDAYNSVLFLSDEQPRVRQVRDVNFSLLAEVLFESIPQFIIVFVNETSQRHRPDSATSTSPRGGQVQHAGGAPPLQAQARRRRRGRRWRPLWASAVPERAVWARVKKRDGAGRRWRREGAFGARHRCASGRRDARRHELGGLPPP